MADVIRARHMRRLMPRSLCWWSLGLCVNAASPKMRTSLNNIRSISMVNTHKFTTTLQCCSIVSAISQKGLYSVVTVSAIKRHMEGPCSFKVVWIQRENCKGTWRLFVANTNRRTWFSKKKWSNYYAPIGNTVYCMDVQNELCMCVYNWENCNVLCVIQHWITDYVYSLVSAIINSANLICFAYRFRGELKYWTCTVYMLLKWMILFYLEAEVL